MLDRIKLEHKLSQIMRLFIKARFDYKVAIFGNGWDGWVME